MSKIWCISPYSLNTLVCLTKKNILKTYRHTHKQLCTIIIGNNLTEKNEEFESSKKIVLEVKTGVWKAFV